MTSGAGEDSLTSTVASSSIAINPIAKVRIDVPVRHLDRDFDYRVPAELDAAAQPGMRVRVRFAGRLVDGVIRERVETADVEKVAPIVKVVGTWPIVTPATMDLAEAVAERYAGTLWDVIRTIVPPRHAAAESVKLGDAVAWNPDSPSGDAWARYGGGMVALETESRVVWSSAPGSDPRQEIVERVLLHLAQSPESGVIVAVPDATDVHDITSMFTEVVPSELVAVLTTEAGPRERYKQFIRVMSGRARVVIGNRAVVAAPVANLGLVVLWDDGDDTYSEPRAPYWDAREVAALRAHRESCALWIGAPARTVTTQFWCREGWSHSLVASDPRTLTVQALHPELERDDPLAQSARIPHAALRVARESLAHGPVLFQVARPGYIRVLACQGCRAPAHCSCGGPLELTSGHAIATCTWCGRLAGDWQCRECASRQIRSISVGAERTAEEIGKALPGVPVMFSQGSHRISEVDSEPRVVVATYGAEPRATDGYAAVIILDAQRTSADLDAGEQRVRRWFSAALHARRDGKVFVAAPESDPAVQALMRWDSVWFAERELDERAEVRLPPVTRWLTVTGSPGDVQQVIASISAVHVVRGPLPIPADDQQRVRAVVIFPRHAARSVVHDVRSAASVLTHPVRIQVDPRSL